MTSQAHVPMAEAQANYDAAVAGPTREERAIADAQVHARPPRSRFSSGDLTRWSCVRQPMAWSAPSPQRSARMFARVSRS